MSEVPIRTVQLGSAVAPTNPTIKVLCSFPYGVSQFSSALSLLFVFGCVYLQVVGMDTDQRTLSRRGPAGEGQGSQPGGPEGPEGRLGATKGLGRKLPGE